MFLVKMNGIIKIVCSFKGFDQYSFNEKTNANNVYNECIIQKQSKLRKRLFNIHRSEYLLE